MRENVGDYVRTPFGITRIKENVCLLAEVLRSSKDVLDLLEPLDLLYIDIDPTDKEEDCLVVAYVCETQEELENLKSSIRNKKWVLKGIVSRETLKKYTFWV